MFSNRQTFIRTREVRQHTKGGLLSSSVSLLLFKFHLIHSLIWKSGHKNFPPRMIALLWTLIVCFHGGVFCYGKWIYIHNVFHMYDQVLVFNSLFCSSSSNQIFTFFYFTFF